MKQANRPRKPNKRRLTETFVQRVKPGPTRKLYWDQKVAGLVLAVHPTGTKGWHLYYRRHGRSRWFHLGSTSALTLDDARTEARAKLGAMAKNPDLDIQAEKKQKRQAGTFRELADRYIEEHAKRKLKSWEQFAYWLKKYAYPRLGNLPAASVSRRDVLGLHRGLTNAGNGNVANLAIAAIGAVYKWAMHNEEVNIAGNPARGIARNKVTARERVLSDAEVPEFWKALEDNDDLIRTRALMLVLLTGQRPGEVRHMREQDVKVGKHRLTDENGRAYTAHGAWWLLPGQRSGEGEAVYWPGTKNGRSHTVWLTQAVLDVLEEVRDRKDTGYMFTHGRGKAVTGLSGTMRAICRRLGVAPDQKATPHDLRRTHGTTVTSLGFTRDQMNRLQNHAEGGIGSVYDRFEYSHEARVIQEAVSSRLMSIIHEEPASNVAQLRG